MLESGVRKEVVSLTFKYTEQSRRKLISTIASKFSAIVRRLRDIGLFPAQDKYVNHGTLKETE